MNSLLNRIVDLLAVCVEDAVPVSESDIRLFAQDKNIPLREDHVQFLMKFGGKVDKRLRIFHRYGGDFDFEYFKSIYIENYPDMRVPEGNAYFGTTYVSGSLCVDFESGKIYAYDEGDRYGLVHESISGFILGCLISVYADKAFSGKVVKLDVEFDCLNRFRVENERNKIFTASAYEIEYVNIDSPASVEEYYWMDNKLTALYPTTQSMVTYSGGILDNINA